MANPDGYNAPIDFRITRNPPGGIVDPVVNQCLTDVYDFASATIATLITYCGVGTYDVVYWPLLATDPGQLLFEGNLNKVYCIANVAITAGQYINLFNVAGVLQARLATGAAIGTQADGYCNADVAIGAVGEFIMSRGNNNHRTGLVVGQRYWLNVATPGSIRTTAPIAAGNVEQYLGIAVSTTELITNIMYPIQH